MLHSLIQLCFALKMNYQLRIIGGSNVQSNPQEGMLRAMASQLFWVIQKQSWGFRISHLSIPGVTAHVMSGVTLSFLRNLYHHTHSAYVGCTNYAIDFTFIFQFIIYMYVIGMFLSIEFLTGLHDLTFISVQLVFNLYY